MFQIFDFLIISLVGEETLFPHAVTSRERVKIHAHFHGCGTHFTVHTYLYTLAQGKRLHQGESKLDEFDFRVEGCQLLLVC